MYAGDLRELVDPAWKVTTGASGVYIFCPFHEDRHRPGMRVFADGAKCFTCGKYLNREEFSSRYSGKHQTAALVLAHEYHTQRRPKRPSVSPVALAATAHQALLKRPEKLRYLANRGIEESLVEAYELGHYGPAYTIPVFGPDDKPVNVRFRRDDDEVDPEAGLGKYWGLRGHNEVMLYPWHKPLAFRRVVLTEGEFDALVLRRYLVSAHSFTNGAVAKLPTELLRAFFADVEQVILARDQDAPGREGSAQLARALAEAAPHLQVRTLTWEEQLAKDVSKLWENSPIHFYRLIESFRQQGFVEYA